MQDLPAIPVNKVDALASLVQRAPITPAEAIFASEFLTFLRNVARMQEEYAIENAQSPRTPSIRRNGKHSEQVEQDDQPEPEPMDSNPKGRVVG